MGMPDIVQLYTMMQQNIIEKNTYYMKNRQHKQNMNKSRPEWYNKV